MVRKALLTLLLSTQLIASGIAQQPQTAPPPMVQRPNEDDVVRISSKLVQVDAVTTDDHGKLVTDLKPQEVEIFERESVDGLFDRQVIVRPKISARPRYTSSA